jgi:hypothetical protein
VALSTFGIVLIGRKARHPRRRLAEGTNRTNGSSIDDRSEYPAFGHDPSQNKGMRPAAARAVKSAKLCTPVFRSARL